MWSALVFAVLLAGASAQLEAVQNMSCTGVTQPIDYEFCGYFPPAQLNIFWTFRDDLMPTQLNVLFEGLPNAWRAFGFSPAGNMLNSRVVFGCHDIPNQADVLEILTGDQRNVAAVTGGIGQGNLAGGGAVEAVVDGVCGIRFERLAVIDGNEAQTNIVADTPNAVIMARGQDTGVPELLAHAGNARGGAQIDFIAGMATNLMNVQMLVGPDMTTNPNPDMTMAPGNDNSAAALSLSSVVVAGVASVLAAL